MWKKKNKPEHHRTVRPANPLFLDFLLVLQNIIFYSRNVSIASDFQENYKLSVTHTYLSLQNSWYKPVNSKLPVMAFMAPTQIMHNSNWLDDNVSYLNA